MLEFSGKISDNECLREIAQNVAQAIKHYADTAGITPDYADEYTKAVTVSSEVLKISEHVIIAES
jgi:hypothetical protein